MSLPYLQAYPAKLVLAPACHVNAPIVLLNGFPAHGALLGDKAVDPLVLRSTDHTVPIPQVGAVKRPMALSSAVATNISTAFALN